MDKLEPKYRRALNEDQLKVLRLLFKFRFATSDLIASRFNKPSGKFVQKRLNILIDQGFIAKSYDKSYKLRGKPASYYLLPKAAKYLQKEHPDLITNQMIKNRYKDKSLSDEFINHSIDLVRVFISLDKLYPGKLAWFSDVELKAPKFDYLPRWLPNGMLRLDFGTKQKPKQRRYFLTMFDQSTPFFVMVRRAKSYISYAETIEWMEPGNFPSILLICPSLATKKRLRKQVVKQLNKGSYDEVATFYLTTKQELFNLNKKTDKIWQLATDAEAMEALASVRNLQEDY